MGSIEDKVAELLAKHGVAKEEFDILPDTEEKKDPPERVRFRGEAVLYALEFPLSPKITKVCKECEEPFLSFYKAVAYCSQECCIRALRSHFGLAWSPNRELKKERWEVRAEPKLIPLKALQAMKAIVAQAEADLGYSIALPEIQPFVPKATYLHHLDNAAESEEAYRISVSPLPVFQSNVEALTGTLQSLASESYGGTQISETVRSSNTTETKIQSQGPEQPSNPVDPLEALFSV